MLKYLLLLGLLAIVGAAIWTAYPELVKGSARYAGDPAAVPRSLYHSLSQHIPKIPHSQN